MKWLDALAVRQDEVDSTVGQRLLERIEMTGSSVMLSVDGDDPGALAELIEKTAPHLAAVKTHRDLICAAKDSMWGDVVSVCKKHGLLIMEDRKFADIGAISEKQIRGMGSISEWADFVTAHAISGPDIIDGLIAGWREIGKKGGVVLLAQMSSRDNLLTPEYSRLVIEMGEKREGVIGYIGNGSDPRELGQLRHLISNKKLLLTPGIHPTASKGKRGQRYGTPEAAIAAGADLVIIGRGIYAADKPENAVKICAERTRDGLERRLFG